MASGTTRGTAATVLAGWLLLATVAARSAVPLLISPTIVEIAAGRHGASIEVTNLSDEPVDLQIRGYDWTQPDGADRLAPSDAVAISPAIATLPPRGKQLFRVLAAGPAPSVEKAYRLRINELPRPGGGEAVTVNLEFLVPMFRSAGDAAPAIRWRITPGGLEIANAGGRHVKLFDATLVDGGGATTPIADMRAVYLLAGSRRVLAQPARGAVALRATTDVGSIDAVRIDALP